MNFKIFASKISGQFKPESGGQFNRYMHILLKSMKYVRINKYYVTLIFINLINFTPKLITNLSKLKLRKRLTQTTQSRL